MVYRRVTGAMFWLFCAQSFAAPVVTEVDKDLIREQVQREVMRMPADTQIEPDLALVRALFRRPVRIESGHIDPVQVPQIQVLTHRNSIDGAQAMKLVADTVRFSVENKEKLSLDAAVLLPQDEVSVGDLLEAIEKSANVAITLYPESRLIVVRRQHGRTR